MRRLLIPLCLSLVLSMTNAPPGAAFSLWHGPDHDEEAPPPPHHPPPPDGAPHPLPLHELRRIVRSQFRGRILRARPGIPGPLEYTLGTNAVVVLLMITPEGDRLSLRLDAETGEVLDLRGRNLSRARKD